MAILASASAAGAAFPGQDGNIVFNSNRDVGAGDIYAIPPSGDVVRVTRSTGSSDPAYSPDGARIAFISANPGGAYQVFLMNADGSGRTPLTTGSSAKQEPAWSPDGREIAFVANSVSADGQTDLEIWAIGVNGGGLRQITHNTVADTSPAWSPTGDRIAFERGQDVWAMDADGGNETNLTPNSTTPCAPACYQGPDSDPAWHPSGTLLAYVHGHTPTGGGLADIWTMNPDGSGKSNLSNDAGVAFTQPAWSPQGDRLAMVGAADTNRDIWLMNSDGSGKVVEEANPASHDINPDWGPLNTSAPPPADTDAPEIDLAGKKSQRLSKAVKQKAGCDEECSLRATGVLLIAKRSGNGRIALKVSRQKLKPARGQVAAGGISTLKLKLKKRTRKLAERALKRGGTVKAKVVVRATDAAGNVDTAKRKLRLKR
jgi:TolB protein